MEDNLLKSLIFIFLTVQTAQAQIANSSVFSEMKSINPAVVSGRVAGQITVFGSQEKMNKDQDMTPILGAGSETKSETTLTQFSFFRGEKGGGLTTEFSAKSSSGDVMTKINTSSQSGTDNSDASFNGFGMLIGFGNNFGIGFGLQTYEYNINSSFSFGIETYNSTLVYDTKFIDIKPGLRFGKGISFGTFIHFIKQSGQVTTTDPPTGGGSANVTNTMDMNSMFIIGGFGLGLKSNVTNFEVSVVRALSTGESGGENAVNIEQKTPMRISLIVKTKIWGITLGYKGNMVDGVFTDVENILQSNLLYPNALNSTRLEHIVNFALGPSKGLSFGASAFYSSSETKEASTYIVSTTKLDTKTESLGFSAKIGYVF